MVAEKSHGMIQTAHRVGVNIAYGTDAFTEVQLSEFDLRAKVLPSPVVLQHATCNGGELGIERCVIRKLHSDTDSRMAL